MNASERAAERERVSKKPIALLNVCKEQSNSSTVHNGIWMERRRARTTQTDAHIIEQEKNTANRQKTYAVNAILEIFHSAPDYTVTCRQSARTQAHTKSVLFIHNAVWRDSRAIRFCRPIWHKCECGLNIRRQF